MGDSGKHKPPLSRRVGDETRKRIDNLAGGWSVGTNLASPSDAGDTERVEKPEIPAAIPPPSPARPPPPPPPPVRAKTPSKPPPLPKPPPPTITPARQRRDDTSADADETILQVDTPGVTRAVSGMRARKINAVPRARGVFGDVQYVFRALFGVARARRELAEIRRDLQRERAERNERLIAVARYVVGDESARWPSVHSARDTLADIEEKRSRHAGAVAAADEDIAGLERTRVAAHEAYEEQNKQLDTELEAIETKLVPLEKQAASARKRIVALKTASDFLAKKVAVEERKLLLVTSKDNPAAVEAHLASIRAEREGVLADEPTLAAELDELDPKIANLTAARQDTRQTREHARERDDTEAVRTAEKIQAAEARKRVEQNAVTDTDRERDQALLELGEQLDVDRADAMVDKLRGADEHAIAIATLEREQMELEELVAGVDRAAFARGVLWLVLALGALVAFVVFMIVRS